MDKKILALLISFLFALTTNATKLIITNNANFVITTYPDLDWKTTDVTAGDQRVVFDDMNVILTSFSAFKKGNVSRTITKYKLKSQFIRDFNNLQLDKSLLDKQLKVQFPEDFEMEVSLKPPR